MRKVFGLIVSGLLIIISFSCNHNTGNNKLSDLEKKQGWQLLFDGTSTKGWHLYNQGNMPSVWEAADGALSCNIANGKEDGDLVTDREFENYDLKFQWKIGADGNSGVFINVLEADSARAAWFTGPEYQLLGNEHPDFAVKTKRAGCMFGFVPTGSPAQTKPAGEWNDSEIKQVNGQVQFYLNGVLTTTENFNSPEWPEKIKKTSFASLPAFGKRMKGRIGLQDWGKGVSFRNIKLRPL